MENAYLQQIIGNTADGAYDHGEINLMSDLVVVMDVRETGLVETSK